MALSQMRLVMMAPDSTKMSVLATYSSSSLHQPLSTALHTLAGKRFMQGMMEQTLAGAVP